MLPRVLRIRFSIALVAFAFDWMSKHKVSVSKFGVIDLLTQTQVQVAGGFWAIGKALGVAKIKNFVPSIVRVW